MILSFIGSLDLSRLKISGSLKASFEEYRRIASQVLSKQNIDTGDNINIRSYSKYLFEEGSGSEKREFIRGLGITLFLYNKKIYPYTLKTNKENNYI